MKKTAALVIFCFIVTACINTAYSSPAQYLMGSLLKNYTNSMRSSFDQLRTQQVLKGEIASNAGSQYERSDARIIVNGEDAALDNLPFMADGRLMAPFDKVVEKLDIKLQWYPNYNQIKFYKDGITVDMIPGDKTARVNGEPFLLDTAPFVADGKVVIPVRFVAEAFKYNVKWDINSKVMYIYGKGTGTTGTSVGGYKRKTFVVVIDAGHGGYESGASSFGVNEKSINLDIAKRLNTLLKNEGVITYMTRESDVYVDLYDRSALADYTDADLLISIHNNANDGYTKGTMTLYYPSDEKARGNLTPRRLASIVQNELIPALGTKNLGIIERPGLAVLRTANVPAVIAEIGFMDVKSEFNKLMDSDFRQRSAEALKIATLKALNETR